MVPAVPNPTLSPGISSLLGVFGTIRAAIETAATPDEIESLHRRAQWLVKIINAPAWERNFGDDLETARAIGAQTLAEITRVANARAAEIGADLVLDIAPEDA